MYYPRKIINEIRFFGDDGQERRIALEIKTLREVELNIDVPDETFEVPFIKGLKVTNYRFDPPKRYKHESPNALDRFLERLDEKLENQET